MRRRDCSAATGSTLVEIVIAVAVLAVLSGIVVQSLIGLARSQRVTERRATMLAVAERVAQSVVLDVGRAFRVYAEDETGQALLGSLSFDAGAPLRDGRLPVVTNRGVFEPDLPTALETGNLLLLGTARAPIAVQYGTGPNDVARVDVLQVVLYYLSRTAGRLELNRWASVPMARADDLAAVVDPDYRTAVVRALVQQDIGIVWRPDAPIGRAFFLLSESGQVTLAGTGFRLPRSVPASRLGMLGRRGVSVAPNGVLPSVRVPAFGQVLGDYPHGFEVKVDGDGAAELVLVRLTVVSQVSSPDDVVHAAVERLVPHRGDR